MTLDNILEEIKKSEKIVILTHETPDGDAIGSSLAMKFAINVLGKEADVIIPEYSECFNFLPGIETIKKESSIERYDLAIALDCADIKILKGNEEYFENAKTKIVIDHHSSNKMYGDINFVNPVSPACCEVLVGIFDYLGIELTKEIGTCIITGIITDTGGFDYNVTAETFDFAAMLLRKGINISEVYRKALKTKSRANFELRKIASDRLEFLEDGKVTFTYITLEDEKKSNAKTGDHDGLVENGRDIEGVEVSIFLRQKEDKPNGFKISLRSSEYVNVSDVCIMFGGGGHAKAAGAFAFGTVEQIKEKLLNEIRKQLK
ncbi:MAG: hypothetical protein HFJ17_00860 [Clostridia bacterium]|nr:hypothetical protein [Clostridia bacterium]